MQIRMGMMVATTTMEDQAPKLWKVQASTWKAQHLKLSPIATDAPSCATHAVEITTQVTAHRATRIMGSSTYRPMMMRLRIMMNMRNNSL
jgi:hypothetical protein